jgi:hypothetical protein
MKCLGVPQSFLPQTATTSAQNARLDASHYFAFLLISTLIANLTTD